MRRWAPGLLVVVSLLVPGESVPAALASSVMAPSATARPSASQVSASQVSASQASASDGLAANVSAAVDRLAGTDRYGTSAQISAQYAPGVPAVYIATGAAFPDALAAGAAAGHDSPVLLVNGGSISSAVSAEVARLKPGKIILVGGANSVPDSVGATLGAMASGGWTRLYGDNRYATAAAVSAATFSPGVPVVYLVSGVLFPDAVTASALGALAGNPVLLTDPAQLPPATITELTRLAPREIVVLGGPASVSDAVLTAARAYSPSVERVQGADRYATNAQADAVVPAPVGTLILATGANFPDALSGAALAGHLGTAMMLVGPSLSDAQKALVARLAPTHVDVLGNGLAVSDQQLNQVLTAAGLPTIAIAPAPGPAAATDYVLSYSGAVGAAGTQVIRWNPCKPIGWKLNAAGLSATAVQTINTEFGQLAQATGMTFRYDGTTTFVPRTDNIDTEPDQLIVAVITRTATDFFDDAPGAVGYGGWQAEAGASGKYQITHGYAILDQAEVAALPAGVQAGQSTGTLTLHELGHAVGLQHAANPTEIMYPSMNPQTPQTYSASDRAGLAKVGIGAGCIS